MTPAVRRTAGATAVLAALVGAPLLTSSADGTTVTGGTTTVSRSSGIPGEELVVKVADLPGPAARAIDLERCVAYVAGSPTDCSYWVRVTGSTGQTTSGHAATFHTRVHAMDRNAYRAVAPATGTSPRVVTPSRAVYGRQQEATITLPDEATEGTAFPVTLSWWVYVDRQNQQPARPGRQVALERRRSDGTWSRIRTVTAPSSGSVTVQVTPTTTGTRTYRTVALTWTPTGQDTRVGWFPSYPSKVVVR